VVPKHSPEVLQRVGERALGGDIADLLICALVENKNTNKQQQ